MFTPDKKCWAFYELKGFQIDFKSIDMRKRYFRRMLGFFWSIDKSARLLFLPESHTFSGHYERLKEDVTGPFAETAYEFADLTSQWLEGTYETNGAFRYRSFVALKISEEISFWDSIKGTADFFKKLVKEPIGKTDRLLGLRGNEIAIEDIRALTDLEHRIFMRLQRFAQMERAEESVIEWAIRRNYWKGIAKPPERFIWMKEQTKRVTSGVLNIKTGRKEKNRIVIGDREYVRPRSSDFMPLTEGIVDTKSNPRMVKITQQIGDEEVASYSAYLVMSEMPDEMAIPGDEYVYKLHDIDFPVGVSIFLEPMKHEEARGKLRTRKKDIDDQTEHTASSDEDLPINLQEARIDAQFLEKDLDDNKFGMFDMSMVFEVTAPDKKTLWERVDALKDMYKSEKIELQNPAGEQWQLMNEFLPCGERLCSKDYWHRVSPHVIAASMFGASKQLGDSEGPFIGTTGVMNIPVYFSLARAPRINRSGSGAILGSLGGGKSFLSNVLGWLAVIHGGKALFFDPKGDRKDWKDHLLELGDELEIVRLANQEEDFGKLDPWGIFPNPDEAGSISMNIFTFLANVKIEDEEFVHLSEAIEYVKVLKPHNRSNFAVLKKLEESDEKSAQKLARKIRAFARLPMAKLIIHDGEIRTINTNRRMTVLQVDQLTLPEIGTKKEEFDISQMLSVAIMMSISAFAIRFSEENPNEFTIVVLDEFWAISGTREGKRLAIRLIRTGRSFFAVIVIVTQNANDLLDEQIKNNLGFAFVYRSSDETEVKNILTFLDLEHTEENIETIKNLENGKPLFKDLDGHCGIVEIEYVFQHLHDAFDTTPGKKKKVS